MRKLDSKGFSHELLIVAFVVIFAIAGTAYIVSSNAQTRTCKSVSGPVSGVATSSRVFARTGNKTAACPTTGQMNILVNDRSTGGAIGGAYVTILPQSGTKNIPCSGANSSGTYSTSQPIVCPPGKYKISYSQYVAATATKKAYRIAGSKTVTVKAGKTAKVNLSVKHVRIKQ